MIPNSLLEGCVIREGPCSGSQSDGSSSSTEQCSVSETVEADSVTRADLRNFFTSVCLKASFMDKVKVLLSNFTAFFKLENQHLGSREGTSSILGASNKKT